MIPPTLCPCGSALSYADCCAPFHNGDTIPSTAEALMRSRFSAFALHNSAYLLATWDVSTRPVGLDLANDPSQWLRLEIVGTKKGGVSDSKGQVSFNAYYRQHGKEGVMAETSRFRKVANRWFYVDGVVADTAKTAAAPSKNSLCPCGSGKKFKRCCG